jgi:predicted Zn-dependent peptidase
LHELAKFARQGPAAEELQRAKDYSVGQMRLGLESSTNQMMWIGEHLLAYGTVTSPDEVERKIVSVTAEQIRRAAADLLRTNRLCLSIITPSKDEAGVKRLLEL